MKYMRAILALVLFALAGCTFAPRPPQNKAAIALVVEDDGPPAYALASFSTNRGEIIKVVSMPLPAFPVGVGSVGEAIVEFEIDVAGTTKDIRVVNSSMPEFGAASVEAIKKWKFPPRRRGFASRAIPTVCRFSFCHAQRRFDQNEWCGSAILNEAISREEEMKNNKPNKALVPTAASVTPAADAPVAPAAPAAHL